MTLLALQSSEPAPEGVRRVALAALDDAIARLEREEIHEARKRIKELRAIARLVGSKKQLSAELRDVAHGLASSRDAEAMVESFDKLRERFVDEWGKRRFGKIRRALVNQEANVDPASAIAALRALRPAIEAWNDPDHRFDLFARGLLRTYRRSRRAMRAAVTTHAPEQFHEWRKRIKDQWYQLQIIEGASPEILGGHAQALRDLSRVLGDDHDLVVLRDTLRANPVASQRLLRAFDRFVVSRMTELEEEADRLGRRVLCEKPKAWLGRLRVYWSVWRDESDRRRRGPKRATRSPLPTNRSRDISCRATPSPRQ
jgi:CHAD domain-containing protein